MQKKILYKKLFIFIISLCILILLTLNYLIDFRTIHSFKHSLKKKINFQNKNQFSDLGFYITSNSKNIFSFKENDQIYIYTNINQIKNLEIYGFNENEKICYKKNFEFNLEINFKDILSECKKAFLFHGRINYNDEQINFLFTKDINYRKSENKNLIIIPISYLFLTYNNTFSINQNDIKNKEIPFVASSKNFPITLENIDEYKYLLKSLEFFFKITDQISFIYDFQIKNTNLDTYENLIFPHHQEYIEKEALNKIDSFLKTNKKIKKIISVGESFKHFYEYDDNRNLFKMSENNNTDYSKYDYITDFKDLNVSSKHCFFNEIYAYGIYVDFKNTKSEKNFFNLKCDKENLPLISQKNFNKNKFINFNQENLIHLVNPKSDIYKYFQNLIQ